MYVLKICNVNIITIPDKTKTFYTVYSFIVRIIYQYYHAFNKDKAHTKTKRRYFLSILHKR